MLRYVARGDVDFRVRVAKVEVIGQLGETYPQHTAEALPHIVRALKDSELRVRMAAEAVIGKFAEAAPNLTGEALA